MQDFNEEEIDKLSKLCRIACTPEEKTLLKQHLGRVLDYVKALEKVDTSQVEPCYRVSEKLANVMREDEVQAGLNRQTFLSNSPAHTGGMIRVPSVIKSHS